ncbi:MAG: dihydrolipoyl dehydrogenase, partial [Alphaproteobacteria bacterium]
ALLRSADLFHQLENADEYGIKIKGVEVDLDKMVERSRAVAAQLKQGVTHLLKKNKVRVFEGRGRLDGKGRVRVEADGKLVAQIQARNVILATGARPRSLPGLKADGKTIWTAREAMTPKTLPKSLLVVGSGAVGIEFASFYRTLGSEVTVVEILDRILPAEDEEIAALARKAFEKQGMTVLTGASVETAKAGKTGVRATVSQGKKKTEIAVERVILAVGIDGNTEGLGLEGTRVKVEKGHLRVDKWSATDEPGIYAIGDLAGPPWLAHKASHEGVACVEHIAGIEGAHPLDAGNVPGCTYCRPQIASVGMTEARARAAGREVRVGRFSYMANGKAIAQGETDGLVKTVFDAGTGELLGAHMIGAEVTELIQGFAVARGLETTEAELMRTVFPHPTLSETMHESVLDAYGRVIHV